MSICYKCSGYDRSRFLEMIYSDPEGKQRCDVCELPFAIERTFKVSPLPPRTTFFDCIAGPFRDGGLRNCERKAQELASRVVGRIVNVGARTDARWPRAQFVDSALDTEMDFNTKQLPFDYGSADCVVCEQVIEHLHNTTHFLGELRRIIAPGGLLLLATENLGSLPNIVALLLGRAPFSTQPLCGKYVGGWKRGHYEPSSVYKNHSTYSGMNGHVRVMCNRQIRQLLSEAGFKDIRIHRFCFNHYVLFAATV